MKMTLIYKLLRREFKPKSLPMGWPGNSGIWHKWCMEWRDFISQL